MLDLIRLICDTGLFVLIWMVQLIIYPSFIFYEPKDLYKWHSKYTKRIAFIVIPLMLGQLLTVFLQLYLQFNWYSMISVILVLGYGYPRFYNLFPYITI